MTKKIELISLLLIMMLGAFLRFWQLGTNPATLYWDEAAIGLDAYSISQTGRDMNNQYWLQPVLGSYGDFKAPVLIWLTSLSVGAFGLNPWAVRLPVALFSLLTVYLVYLLVHELIKFEPKFRRYNLMPLLTALVVAISPWSVHFGRIGLESSLSVAFLLLALIFFLKAVHKHSWMFLLSTFWASLAVYSYYSLRLIVPLLCFALVIIFWQQIKVKKIWLLAAMIFFVLSMLPMVNSPYYARSQDYRLNNNNLIHHRQAIEESSRYLEKYDSSLLARLLYHRYVFVSRDFLVHMSAHFSADFLFLRGDQNLRQHSGYLGEFLLVMAPFFYMGVILLLINWRSKLSWFLLALMILSPIPAAMVYNEVPHASRAIYLFIPFAILIAWGFQEFYLRFGKIVVTAVLSLAALNALFYYSDYFLDYRSRSSAAWLYSYHEVALYLKENYQQFSEVEIDERYFFPRIFIYYHFPELLEQTRELKNAFLNSPVNSFGLPDPFDYLLDKKDRSKGSAKFIYYESDVPVGYKEVERFPFLNGEESLILVVKEGQTENNE
jgi:4-amino-4-deoxy-L-arabinose transferase-like glycosyltransferase